MVVVCVYVCVCVVVVVVGCVCGERGGRGGGVWLFSLMSKNAWKVNGPGRSK